MKKGILRIFAKFTGKRLCQSLFFNKVGGLRYATLLKKRLWHMCFPVNFTKFLGTPFFIEHLWTTALMFDKVLLNPFICSTYFWHSLLNAHDECTEYSPANIYLFKVNNRITWKKCEIWSKLTIKTPERSPWRRSGVFIVNFEHYFTSFSSVSIIDFEQVNDSMEVS